MKKLLASLGFVAVLALSPAQANALDLTAGVFPDAELAAASSRGHHFAVGGGTAFDVPAGTTTHFAFSAHCKDPLATCFSEPAASGYAVFRSPELGRAQGHVCDYFGSPGVPGARFWIDVEKGSGAFGSAPFIEVLAFDNFGGQGDGLLVRDQQACGIVDSGEFAAGGGVIRGNIVVK